MCRLLRLSTAVYTVHGRAYSPNPPLPLPPRSLRTHHCPPLQHLADDIDIFAWALDEKTDMANLDASTKPPGKPSFMCTA